MLRARPIRCRRATIHGRMRVLVGVGWSAWSTKLAHKRPLKPPLELFRPGCITLVSLVQVGTARCRVASCRPAPRCKAGSDNLNGTGVSGRYVSSCTPLPPSTLWQTKAKGPCPVLGAASVHEKRNAGRTHNISCDRNLLGSRNTILDPWVCSAGSYRLLEVASDQIKPSL